VKKNTDDNGYTLVLRSLATARLHNLVYVKDYMFSKPGNGLLFVTSGNDSTMKAGVYWNDIASNKLQSLHAGHAKYKYKALSISEDGSQVAFIVDTDTTKTPVRHPQLFLWKNGEATAKHYDIENSLALPANWLVSDSYTPTFSKDGSNFSLDRTQHRCCKTH